MRSKALCVFDVLYSRGISYCREISSYDDEAINAEIERAAKAFGNLGLVLTDDETKTVRERFRFYARHLPRRTELVYFEPDFDWNDFRKSFG